MTKFIPYPFFHDDAPVDISFILLSDAVFSISKIFRFQSHSAGGIFMV